MKNGMDFPMDMGRLMGLRYKSHPWHGVSMGNDAPNIVISFIEMVTNDAVKYEVDKESGYLRLDRPQKYSNLLPALYGFLPQTYCGENVAAISNEKLSRTDIIGDGDPLDICVLTEKNIVHGDILVKAKPIGGFRMLDGNEADDKIIAVLMNDALYGEYEDISELPESVINRLRHYFLTYKEIPSDTNTPNCTIPQVYGAQEARDVIETASEDYRNKFSLERVFNFK